MRKRLVALVALVALTTTACLADTPGEKIGGGSVIGDKTSYTTIELPDGRVLECIFWRDRELSSGELIAGMDCNWPEEQ